MTTWNPLHIPKQKKSYCKPEVRWGLVFSKRPVPPKHRMAFLHHVATLPRKQRLNPGRTCIDFNILSKEDVVEKFCDVAQHGGSFRFSVSISDGRMDENGESPCIATPFKKRGRWLRKKLRVVKDEDGKENLPSTGDADPTEGDG